MAKKDKKTKGDTEVQPAQTETLPTEALPPTDDAPKAASKSIVDPKYRNKYKGEDAKDFVSHTIDKLCTVSSEADGKVTTAFSTDKLFDLAAINGGKTAKLDKLKTQAGGRGYGPRMRMTLANVIRASARKRHGIMGTDGTFLPVDDAFKAKHAKFMKEAPTHNPDGSKIKKEAPAAEPAAAAA